MNRPAPILIAGATLMLGMWLARPAAAQAAQLAALNACLIVSDQVGVPPEVLAGARAEVSRVYRNIGVDVIWLQDASTTTGHRLAINIVREAMAPPKSTDPLGTTIVGGTLAYVVFDRVEPFAGRWGNSVAITLGLTLSHELGHLLLEHGSHAVSGLMRRTWNAADAGLAAAGKLLFWPSEAARIRKNLSARPCGVTGA